MYTIRDEFTFNAAHLLEGLPDGHKCGNLHGHTYKVELRLSYSGVDARGFLLDFADMAPFKELLDTRLDHRFLNEVLDVNPTAENIARWLYDRAAPMFEPLHVTVRVWETPRAWAEYSKI